MNHLLFADDSLLFAHATPNACTQIQEVIQIYGRSFGQQVNFHKSSVAFSKNLDPVLQALAASNLGVEIAESHEKYLGSPTFVGREKTATFQYIKDRLAVKLKGGKESF